MIVSPSILSADFGNLDRDIDMLNASAAQLVHIDVMDGVFVPNISFGFPVIEAVRRRTEKPLDVHLMIVQPEKFIDRLADLGVGYINVHQEACVHLDSAIAHIRRRGCRPAVTLNPSTPVEMLTDVLPLVDMVLLMSVNPGFGGQSIVPYIHKKIERLRRLIESTGSHALIEIDGGVTADNAPSLAASGADILVSGSAIFRAPDPKAVIAEMVAL